MNSVADAREDQDGGAEGQCPRRVIALLQLVDQAEHGAEDGNDGPELHGCPAGPVQSHQVLAVAELEREQRVYFEHVCDDREKEA